MKNLCFTYLNRSYRLFFNDCNIMQLMGDSSTGKSLLCSDFQSLAMITPELSNSLVVDYTTRSALEALKTKHVYDFVFIDNADVILTPEYDKIILHKIETFIETSWIIIGRSNFSCVITASSRGRLLKKVDSTGHTLFCVDYTRGNTI